MTSAIVALGLVCVILGSGCSSRTMVGAKSAIADIQILGFNDFHGALEPPTGANGRVGDTAAGGVEYLAAHISRLKAENPNTIVVSAGDNIGASSLLSGMFHDEPTVEALSAAGLQVSTVGNHEFDEGWEELTRMQKGGCHPADGCQDGTPFTGAGFEFLAANVRRGGQALFPATTVKIVDGIKVGFIGLALEGTPSIVGAAFVKGLAFSSEVAAGNEAAAALVAQGIKTIIVVIHAGGQQSGAKDVNGCELSGSIVDVANQLSADVDVIVSGHTHQAYVCSLGTKLVTSARSNGVLITDIELKVDRATGDVVSKSATNVIVTRDVDKSSALTSLIEHYRPFFVKIGQRRIGTLTAPLLEADNEAGESALGDVIADAILAQTSAAASGGAQVALWNSGGIRADLIGQPTAAGEVVPVTFSQAFDVLPFGNRVEVRSVTGAALIAMLETGVFQVSRGVSYQVDPTRPRRERVVRGSIMFFGRSIDPTARFRVATSDYIWNGGDAVVVESGEPLDAGADIDLFVAYLEKHSPVRPGPQDRIILKR